MPARPVHRRDQRVLSAGRAVQAMRLAPAALNDHFLPQYRVGLRMPVRIDERSELERGKTQSFK